MAAYHVHMTFPDGDSNPLWFPLMMLSWKAGRRLTFEISIAVGMRGCYSQTSIVFVAFVIVAAIVYVLKEHNFLFNKNHKNNSTSCAEKWVIGWQWRGRSSQCTFLSLHLVRRDHGTWLYFKSDSLLKHVVTIIKQESTSLHANSKSAEILAGASSYCC